MANERLDRLEAEEAEMVEVARVEMARVDAELMAAEEGKKDEVSITTLYVQILLCTIIFDYRKPKLFGRMSERTRRMRKVGGRWKRRRTEQGRRLVRLVRY